MRAVVLVGGFGTRLRPLTNTTPKPLLPVGHRPILEWVVENLARGGVTEAVLSLGFNPDAFLAAYPDGYCAGVLLRYAVEPEPLDTAGAIRFAARAAGIDDTFVVANGDVLTDLDVARLLAFHCEHGGEATIHLTPVDDPSRFGVVSTDDDGRVLAFVEKPKREEAPTNLVNGGTYVLEPSVLDRIPDGRRVSIERETFPALVADGRMYALATDDYWLDAGKADIFLRANLDLIDGHRRVACAAIHPEAVVAPRASVHRSMLGPGVVVEAGASVEGSVLLPGVLVQSGASVRWSLLGRNVVVGPAADLDDAVIGDGEHLPSGLRVHVARIPAST